MTKFTRLVLAAVLCSVAAAAQARSSSIAIIDWSGLSISTTGNLALDFLGIESSTTISHGSDTAITDGPLSQPIESEGLSANIAVNETLQKAGFTRGFSGNDPTDFSIISNQTALFSVSGSGVATISLPYRLDITSAKTLATWGSVQLDAGGPQAYVPYSSAPYDRDDYPYQQARNLAWGTQNPQGAFDDVPWYLKFTGVPHSSGYLTIDIPVNELDSTIQFTSMVGVGSVAQVPEPESYAFLAAGLTTLLIRRKRKR